MSTAEQEKPSTNDLHHLIESFQDFDVAVSKAERAQEIVISGEGARTIIEGIVQESPRLSAALYPKIVQILEESKRQREEHLEQLAKIAADTTHQHHEELVGLVRQTVGYMQRGTHQQRFDQIVEREDPIDLDDGEKESLTLLFRIIRLSKDQMKPTTF